MRRETPYRAVLKYGPFKYEFTVRSGPFLPSIIIPKPMSIEHSYVRLDEPPVKLRQVGHIEFRWTKQLDPEGIEHLYEFWKETHEE